LRRLLLAVSAVAVLTGAAALVVTIWGPGSLGGAVAAGASRVRADEPPAQVGDEPAVQYDADESGPQVQVEMRDNVYTPQTLTVDPGTVVVWDNQGRSKHNVIPDKASTGWKSKTIKPGRSFAQKLDTPGAIGYFCSFHGAPGRGMYGTLIVKNPDGTIPKAALDRSDRPRRLGKPRTIRVPQDEKRIQSAVDRAAPGSLILISPGVYKEAVTVTTDRLVLRGLDRNKVILDGGFELDNGIKVLGADGVAVENMSARNYTQNGFFWTGVKGYRGSYLTSSRTGDYAIYAFDSTDGIFDHDYGSGAPDAGFYIGQCFPCNALVTDVIAEYNGLGWSGTNAGGNLIIKDSIWRHNRAGIVPNSGSGELNPPEKQQTVVGNLVYDNNNGKTPAIDSARLAQGNGILIAGGEQNLITRNRVWNHDIAGIAAVLNPETVVFYPNDNKVVDNVVSDSGEADLAWFGGEGNCFADNRFTTSKPSNIEQLLPCSGPPTVQQTDTLDLQKYVDATKPASVNYRTAKTPKPPRLRGMKNPAKAKARPADAIVVEVDVDAIELPRRPKNL
jgi:plastocyanin